MGQITLLEKAEQYTLYYVCSSPFYFSPLKTFCEVYDFAGMIIIYVIIITIIIMFSFFYLFYFLTGFLPPYNNVA